MKTVTILVDNLKCHGCANTIRKGLMSKPGVTDVDVNVDTSEVTIHHDPSVELTQLLHVLSGMGYPEQGTSTGFQKAKSYVSCAVGRLAS